MDNLNSFVDSVSHGPVPGAPANVTGKWTLYCNDSNGRTSAKYLELHQEGANINGRFKGPNQSGGIEDTINEQHLVVRTKTCDVLMVRNPDGSCSAAICNTRTQPHQEMDTAIYDMLWNLAQSVSR